jgi:hypothetical protein
MISCQLRIRHFLLVVMLLNLAARAQTAGSNAGQSQTQPEGWETNGYQVHQSVELGYRVSDVSGSIPMYNTLVDLRSGPRLLDQTLSMRSLNHDGSVFDNLFIDSFGWGGDPNNALHARVGKDKWYDFRGSFRRDQTDFDYNLLANPLNPPTSSPSVPVPFSPHSFYTRRRMTDLDLTVLPLSKIDFRVGYFRNNMTGPSYSSVHEGTDALLYQAWNTTMNSYRFGVDVKVLPRTVISYDQFLDYYKGDTNWQLAPFAPALLPSPPPGVPTSVELGLPIDTANKNPCAVVPPATSLIGPTGTLTNTACNGFFAYNRTNPVRTFSPTERLSLHTTYYQRLEFSASYAYSSADMNAPLDEFFNGLIQRSDIRQESVVGIGHASRVSNVADFTATLHLSEHFRLVDTFRYWAYRIPEAFSSSETDWTCTSLPNCSLITPISATTQGTPAITSDQLSFNQKLGRNEIDLIWDILKHVGARVGFRYGDQDFFRVNDFATGDEDHIVVHQFTPVAAFWAKPTPNLRLNFDFEHTNNDNTIVRIGPRKESRYRVQANYTPRPWAVLGGSVNLWQATNDNSLIEFQGHNRNYGLTSSITPWDRFGFDFAYNYTNYQQNALICFNDSATYLPVVANAGSCTTNGYDDPSNPLLTNGYYTSNINYGMASVMLKPVPWVTTQVGYSISSVGGQTPQFNSLQPFGSLQYNYHQPLANLAIDIGHNLTWKAAWNYYQYGEKSFVGPTDPRYFHANNATFSLRWAF